MKVHNPSETTAMPLILNYFSAPLNRPPLKREERSLLSPLHPSSNEGAPLISGVALKNPPRAQ